MADLHRETCMALDILSNPIMIAHSDMTVKFVNKAALTAVAQVMTVVQPVSASTLIATLELKVRLMILKPLFHGY